MRALHHFHQEQPLTRRPPHNIETRSTLSKRARIPYIHTPLLTILNNNLPYCLPLLVLSLLFWYFRAEAGKLHSFLLLRCHLDPTMHAHCQYNAALLEDTWLRPGCSPGATGSRCNCLIKILPEIPSTHCIEMQIAKLNS